MNPDLPVTKTLLQFVCRNYVGTEVLTEEGKRVMGLSDLAVGQRVLLWGLDARVETVRGKTATAQSTKSLWHLEFEPDDRGGWICTCGASKAAIEKVQFA